MATPEEEDEAELKEKLMEELLADGATMEEIEGIDLDGAVRELTQEAQIQAIEPQDDPEGMVPMGFPGGEAMGQIQEEEAQAAAPMPPMTEQVGMTGMDPPGPAGPLGPPAPAEPMELPTTDSVPNIPMGDPSMEELAQRYGQVEAEFGGKLRAANLDMLGGSNMAGTQQAAAMGLPKDTAKLQESQDMAQLAENSAARADIAGLELEEARDAVEIATVNTMQQRTLMAEEQSRILKEDLVARDELQKQSEVKAAESLATVTQELATFKAMKVDPKRAMNEMSTGRKIGFVLLSLFGGMVRAAQQGAGITPQGASPSQRIYQRLQNIINQDIAAQKEGIQLQRGVVEQAYKMDASVNRNISDSGARLAAKQALRLNVVKAELDAQLAKISEPEQIAEAQELRAILERAEATAMSDAQRKQSESLFKASQYSNVEVNAMGKLMTLEDRAKDRIENRDIRRKAADESLRRYETGQRRADRGEARQVRQDEFRTKQEGRRERSLEARQDREGAIDERARRRDVQRFEKESSKDAEFRARYNRVLAGFSGEHAPTRSQRFLYNKVGGFAGDLVGMSDETKAIIKNYTEIKLRLIKDITGVAGREHEAAEIKSVLDNPASTKEQIARAIQDALDILDGKMLRKRKAYPTASKRFEPRDTETPEQGLKRRLRSGPPTMAR